MAVCKDLPITLIFLPASDIPSYVSLGDVSMGITGYDCCVESGCQVEKVMELGFGKCKLCLQAPVADGVEDPRTVVGGRICTSFPNITNKYIGDLTKGEEGKEGETSVRFVSGSVEAACGLNLADAVVDIVETGTTMRAAGLEVVSTIMESEAVLIKNPKVGEDDEISNLIKDRVEGYITAQRHVMITYNVTRALMDKCIKITPGKKSPTVTKLEDGESVAVSALVQKGESAKKMDDLKEAGATDILLFDISNSRM